MSANEQNAYIEKIQELEAKLQAQEKTTKKDNAFYEEAL